MREKAKSEVKRVRKSEYMRKKVTAYEVENAGREKGTLLKAFF